LIFRCLKVNKPLKRTFLGIEDFFGKHLGLFWELRTFLGKKKSLFKSKNESEITILDSFRTFLGRK
jgi:hypothetical protein